MLAAYISSGLLAFVSRLLLSRIPLLDYLYLCSTITSSLDYLYTFPQLYTPSLDCRHGSHLLSSRDLQYKRKMHVPYLPARPVDIYTVRITEHAAQTSVSMALRRLVAAAGGTFMLSLMEGPGFM